MKVKVKFKKLYPDTQLPKQAHPGDAGMDLFAYTTNSHFGDVAYLKPGERTLVKCGFSMAIENGWEAQVRPRSGLALKNGLSIVNTPGTIDSTYRGEVGVILINHGTETFRVNHGDRIAQMVIAQVPEVEVEEVDELDKTVRGTGGFGSSDI